MEDIMDIVKEANVNVNELRKNWTSKTNVDEHYRPFYKRVDTSRYSFNFFLTVCMADLTVNFIGGGMAEDEGDTNIVIK